MTVATLQDVARRVAVQQSVPGIVTAAVDGARELLGTDAAFAARACREEKVYAMSITRGTTTPEFRDITLAPMAGLGGRVAALCRPMAVHDYLTDEGITRDFVEIVGREGLRGMACVPVRTTLGVEALLYVAGRSPGFVGDRALQVLADLGTLTGVAIDQAWSQQRQRELGILRERQRLATILHDSVAQTLFAIGVEAKRNRDDEHPAHLADALASIAALASQAGAELRETLHRINDIPPPQSLAVALDAEARAFEKLGDLTVRVVTSGEARSLPEIHETLICDTVHEGVRNAVKHSGARLVVVHLRYGEREVGVTVQSDRPVEHDPGAEPRPRGGLALLRARAQALRGELEFRLGEEGEAIVRLRLPHHPPQRA